MTPKEATKLKFETIEQAYPTLLAIMDGDLILPVDQCIKIGKYKLTHRQIIYVQEYMQAHCNGQEAVRRTGYNTKASNILKSPIIRQLINFEKIRLSKLYHIKTDEVIRELKSIGFSDIRDFMKWGSGYCYIKDSSELTRDEVSAIREVTINSDGVVTVKLWDKNKALETLAKYLKMVETEIKMPDLEKVIAASIGLKEEMTEEEALQQFTEKLRRPTK